MNRVRLLLAFLLAALPLGGMPVAAQTFEQGMQAYQAEDFATALKIFRTLADQGNTAAQVNLGIMYSNGEGVMPDDAEATRWIRKAADQGFAAAQIMLALMYDEGQGVKQDHAEAVKWFRKAADQNHVGAQLNLGLIYHAGRV